MKLLLLVSSALLYAAALCLPALYGGDTSLGGFALFAVRLDAGDRWPVRGLDE